MSAKSRRPWIQLHLSTAIVLMFVAGFGMYLWSSRSPWGLTHEVLDLKTPLPPYSPDRTHFVATWSLNEIRIFEMKPKEKLYVAESVLWDQNGIHIDENERLIASIACSHAQFPGFIDDETIGTWAGNGPEQTTRYSVIRCRFPEPWWGQFLRLDLWLGVLAFAIGFRIIRRGEGRAP